MNDKCDRCDNVAVVYHLIEVADMPVDLELQYCQRCEDVRNVTRRLTDEKK